jgi:hypothetical protein
VARVRTRIRAALLAAALALVLTQAIALAAAPTPTAASPLLWATINVCNTPAHPDTVGIRGSMPGTGDSHERMYMRFAIEYRSATFHWHYLRAGGQSRFVAVGNGSSVARQAGQDFVIAPSTSGPTVLRGVVVFEWRLHGHAVATSVRATRAGHTAAAGADPPFFSAATCKI